MYFLYKKTALGDGFVPYLEKFTTYLEFGISDTSKKELCRICVFTIGDLLSSVGENFNKYLPKVMPNLIQMSMNPQIDPSIKLHCILVFCDAFLYCKHHRTLKYNVI